MLEHACNAREAFCRRASTNRLYIRRGEPLKLRFPVCERGEQCQDSESDHMTFHSRVVKLLICLACADLLYIISDTTNTSDQRAIAS